MLDHAERIIASLEGSSAGSPMSAYHEAIIRIGLGEHERALDLLEAAADERSLLVRLAKVEPKMDALRREPRFEALLRRLGLSGSEAPTASLR